MPAEIDKALTEFYASKFWQAVEKGIGIDLNNIDLEAPDNFLIKQLRSNVYHFSAAKNYQQLKSITQQLLDEDGALRSFTAFRNAAQQVVDDFVGSWLQAEYNFAVASAQMASRWQDIESDKEILPLLRYDTVGDERVRLEHQELQGVTLPVNHQFWDIYYPPNGWGCRCDVLQLDSGKITDYSTIVLPEKMPELFKYNAGKKGVVFPPGHAYYNGLPAYVADQANDLLNG